MDNISYIISVMPSSLKSLFLSLEKSVLLQITEIRLRKNKPIIIYVDGRPFFINRQAKLMNYYNDVCVCIDEDDFCFMTDNLCNNSYHTKMDSMINGYITTNSGIRVGIASTAVIKDGAVKSVRDITSLNIRIAKEIINCSRPVLNMLYVSSTPSIIVAAPPSGGKTTFLRDAARNLSSGFAQQYRKVVIADEREEISGDFEIGFNTDVIKRFSKAQAIESAVRSLAPDIIICDEIGNDNELDSIKFGFSSGVSFIVTVHAKDKKDLLRRSIVRNLIALNEFDYIVLLKNYTNDFEIYDLSEAESENCRKHNDNYFFDAYRDINSKL